MSSTDRLIAVVDDEAPVRTMLGRLLKLADYDVAAFACDDDLIASLATRPPDCVILDVHLPGMSGFDVQSRMRAAPIDLRTIFITASDDLSLELRVAQVGGIALLRKPFSNDALLDAIDAALQRKSGGGS